MIRSFDNRVILITGLAGSGKSTLARCLRATAKDLISPILKIDGDELRSDVFSDLGFDPKSRSLYFLRVSNLFKLLRGVPIISSFICPLEEHRELLRKSGRDIFHIYLSTPLEVCKKRHQGYLYTGKYEHVPGFNSPFEAPKNAELTIDTSNIEVDECVDVAIGALASV